MKNLAADFERLATEHRSLMGHLGKVQKRNSEMLAAQAAEIERLRGEVMRLRAQVIARDTELAFVREEKAALEGSAPALPKRAALARTVDALKARVQELMRERLSGRSASSASGAVPLGEATTLADLREKAVLCLGRDESAASFARRMVEMAGGQFVHRSIGETEDAVALEASLIAADLVICQSGCVSHDAYWLVQDHCRRTGKQCVLLEQPRAPKIAPLKRVAAGTSGS